MVDHSQMVEVFGVRASHHVRRSVVEQRDGTELGHHILAPERFCEDPNVESRPNGVCLVWREIRRTVWNVCGGVSEGGERFGEAGLHESRLIKDSTAGQRENFVYDGGLAGFGPVLGHRRMEDHAVPMPASEPRG